MGIRQELVSPIILDANATLASLRGAVAAVAELNQTLAGPVEWVLVRSTMGFQVQWRVTRLSSVIRAIDEVPDGQRRLGPALQLEQQPPLAIVQLSTLSELTPTPCVVMSGGRVHGFLPPMQRASVPRSRGVGEPASTRDVPRSAPRPAPAPAVPAAPVTIDAAAYVNAPRRVLPGVAFSLEIGLSNTAVANVEGGKVAVAFQANEDAVDLDIAIQAEGFTCATGFRHPLRIPRSDPFTPRITLRLQAVALPDGINEELRALHISFGCRGITCGIATWRILVQRTAVPVDLPPAGTPRVAINTATPPIDLTLESVWKDDNPASQTLCWSYRTPHAVTAPAGKMTRSSADLSALPLAIVNQLATNDGKEWVETFMAGLGERIRREIPAGVWEVLHSVTQVVRAQRGADARATVLMLSSETRIPWELAVLPETVDPLPPGTEHFLRLIGTEYVVSRWLIDDDVSQVPPHQLEHHDLVAVFGDYSAGTAPALPFARKEADFLATRNATVFDADASKVTKLLEGKQTTATGAPLRPGVIHFAGHGEAAQPNTPASFIQLNDGSMMDDTVFLGSSTLRTHKPLVFLNACQLGASTNSLGCPGGAAVVLVQTKCSAVIAPLWSVNDEVAHDVATHFYDAVLGTGGAPAISVAEALRAARAPRFSDITLRAADGTTVTKRTATRLAYILYGHPALHV